jgi:lauroyl/myristoyl acyltransferase
MKQPDGRYRLILEDPPAIKVEEGDGPGEIVGKCLRIFEKSVEKYPGQWYFFERLGS